MKPPMHTRLASKVTLGYAVIACLWILFSDALLATLVKDPTLLTVWASAKGIFFVLFTAGLLFVVLKRELGRSSAEADRRTGAETALRESEARFRLIADTINEIFWIRDPRTNQFLYMSPGYERIWGRPVAQLLGSPDAWMELVVAEDRERVAESVRKFEIAGDHEMEFRIARPDGSTRWIHATTFPVTDTGGRVTRIVGIAQDVSERKRLEQQFLRAQRLESLGTLAGGVAHDLNNILAPILMGSSLLRRKDADPEEARIVDMMQTAAQRGAGIIRQLLTFSRGMEGQRTLMQVRHLLKETLAMVRETFPRNVSFELDAGSDLWPVQADPTLLHQVFMNLCVNARDAMPSGGELHIGAVNATLGSRELRGVDGAGPGPYIVVSVRDTGEGISPENLDRIFDPFFTTKSQGHGTGLGLATVLGIVKSHGGFVTVDSEVGRGSCFRIHLPATPDLAVDDDTGEKATIVDGRGELVLVVDDEENILETSGRALKESNYRVLTARNGEEAMKMFLDHRGTMRLIVTDLIMPVMDGLALIRAARSLDKNLPVIATSGLNDEDKTAELSALGVSRILGKPYSARTLREAVAQEIAQHAADHPASMDWWI